MYRPDQTSKHIVTMGHERVFNTPDVALVLKYALLITCVSWNNYIITYDQKTTKNVLIY